MKHYTKRLTVYTESIHPEWGRVLKKIKAFLGNDDAELIEKYERWIIKQGFDRAEVKTSIESVQHANNRV